MARPPKNSSGNRKGNADSPAARSAKGEKKLSGKTPKGRGAAPKKQGTGKKKPGQWEETKRLLTSLQQASAKPFKFALGLFLIPFCLALTRTLIELAHGLKTQGEAFPGELGRWLIGGFAVWMLIFLLLPRPVRLYVLGHELTHAFWAFFMGGKFSKLEISDEGGSVEVSNANFLVMLAPYFFPIYTLFLMLLFGLLSLFWDLTPWLEFWMGLFGLSWGFHVTFTALALLHDQTDISENGYLFSYTVIYTANLIGILIWIIAVASPTLEHAHHVLSAHTPEAYQEITTKIGALFQAHAGQ